MRHKRIAVKDTVRLDSSIVVPATIVVFDDTIKLNNTFWRFDFLSNSLIFNKLLCDTVIVYYRVLPYNFTSVYKHDTSEIVSRMSDYSSHYTTKNSATDDLEKASDLIKQGQISRGITVGNNQDPAVISSMNLQISGKLNNDLNVQATITDASMPIQPEGNTARIKDFNEIFLKAYNDKFSVEAGDLAVAGKRHFLVYNRQIKGIKYSTNSFYLDSSEIDGSFDVSLAVNKGKFVRQKITPVEGTQGPYKLSGQNNEVYILIVAGSEKVYVNGQLQSRGEQADYTIDYNTAEIIFTPNVPVTKDLRIVVEFEYFDRNYTRFQTTFSSDFQANSADFYFDYFSEKDAKNQPVDLSLNDTTLMLLAEVGDSLQNAVIGNAKQTNYDPEKILYTQKDTIVDSVNYTIYEYSQSSDEVLYAVSFSYVGANKGDYVVSGQAVNGRIYKWIAPVNGISQGDYSPEYQIVAPQLHRVYEFGGDYIKNKNLINFSVALSDRDLNLFSTKDDKDNRGLAVNMQVEHFFTGNDTSAVKSGVFANCEFTGKTFSEVQVFRNQEFNRDWAIDTLLYNNVWLGNTGLFFASENLETNLGLSVLKNGSYRAIMPSLSALRHNMKFNYQINTSYLLSENRHFGKSKADVNYGLPWIVTGLRFEQETNETYYVNGELSPVSFQFYSGGFYLRNTDTSHLTFEGAYIKRFDFLPQQNNLQKVDFSDNYSVTGKWHNQLSELSIILKYRRLDVVDTSLSEQKNVNSLNGLFLASSSFLRNSLRFNSTVSISSGLEQKMEYVFIEVEPSKGTYTWNDYNNDGIKQIDEFEFANFSDEANYQRVAIPTNQYVKIFTKKLSFGLMFYPVKIFKNQTKFSKLAGRVTNSTTFSIDHKGENFDLYDFADTSAIRFNSALYNMLSVRIYKTLKFDYIKQITRSNMLIISGVDEMKKDADKFALRFKIFKKFQIKNEFELFDRLSGSDYSLIKNYHIKGNKNILKFSYSHEFSVFTLHYAYTDEFNLQGGEKLFSNEIGLSANLLIISELNILAEVNAIDNNYIGLSNTNVSYIMMNGLKPDFNLTWNITAKKKLSDILQLSVTYSGRYSTGNKIIHTGNVNIVAFM